MVTVGPIGGKGTRAGILAIDKGKFDQRGKWLTGRRLNGDQSHQDRHLRIPIGEHDVQRIELYDYK